MIQLIYNNSIKYNFIKLLSIVVLLRFITACADDRICYITKTGKKYHNYGCRYLDNSKISISCGEASQQGYKPCSVCK